ncbi:MAG: hypothetical protein D5R98_02055 [Desulfonatronovibrio sp. MSAO_Bac4]|nr:MAG: hypothetical protein D5R98_02055 [Desulfonatronovibrio sp. MSAO_Bac4]
MNLELNFLLKAGIILGFELVLVIPHFMHGMFWAIQPFNYPFHARFTLGNSAPSLPISGIVYFGQLIPQIPHFMHGLFWAIQHVIYPFQAMHNLGSAK